MCGPVPSVALYDTSQIIDIQRENNQLFLQSANQFHREFCLEASVHLILIAEVLECFQPPLVLVSHGSMTRIFIPSVRVISCENLC